MAKIETWYGEFRDFFGNPQQEKTMFFRLHVPGGLFKRLALRVGVASFKKDGSFECTLDTLMHGMEGKRICHFLLTLQPGELRVYEHEILIQEDDDYLLIFREGSRFLKAGEGFFCQAVIAMFVQ